MHVGVCRVSLRLPGALSLKDKRRIIKSITARVSNRFNVSVAEIDNQDTWQLSTIGIAFVSNDKRHVNEVLSCVVNFISNSHLETEMLDYEIEILPVF